LVLTLQTCGKYLSRSWAADRDDAMEHRDRYTAAELAFLEVPAVTVPESYFEAETTPTDGGTPVPYDLRDPRYRPEVGA
jgi:hypothetical protein